MFLYTVLYVFFSRSSNARPVAACAPSQVTVVAASDASVGVAIDIAKAFPTAARPLVPISQPLRLTSVVRPANGTAFVPGTVLSYFWSTPNAVR